MGPKNCGNEIITIVSFGMKNRINAFRNTSSTIRQNGRMINFINNGTGEPHSPDNVSPHDGRGELHSPHNMVEPHSPDNRGEFNSPPQGQLSVDINHRLHPPKFIVGV